MADLTFTQSDIARMKKLYKGRFGLGLSDEEATYELRKLANSISEIYCEITQKDLERLKDLDGDKNGNERCLQ